jgi:hypothetical protein
MEPALPGRDVPGLIMWAGSTTGPRVCLSKYTVRLTVDGEDGDAELRSQEGPAPETTPEEYAKQLSLSPQVRNKLSDTNDAVICIRELRKQLEELQNAIRRKSLTPPRRSIRNDGSRRGLPDQKSGQRRSAQLSDQVEK